MHFFSKRSATAVRSTSLIMVLMALFAVSCSTTTEVPETVDTPSAQELAADDVEQNDPQPGSVDEEQVTEPEPVAETPEPTPVDEETTPEPESLASGEASVVLLDAGAEPRVELRLVIAPSCGEVLTIVQSQELTQSINGAAQPTAGLIGTLVETATSATPNGDNYDTRSEIISARAAPGTPPAFVSTLNADLAPIVGLTSFTTMTNRAEQVPGSARVEGAEGLGAFSELVEGLNQVQSPLPLEAVGVGARWETRSAVDLQGLSIVTVTQNELVSIDGTVVEIRVSSTQQVPLGSEMNIEGSIAVITEWTVTGEGTTIVDLATISPISSDVSSSGTQGFSIGQGASAVDVLQDLAVETQITSVPNDGCTGRTILP